jgi:hypothetical protein
MSAFFDEIEKLATISFQSPLNRMSYSTFEFPPPLSGSAAGTDYAHSTFPLLRSAIQQAALCRQLYLRMPLPPMNLDALNSLKHAYENDLLAGFVIDYIDDEIRIWWGQNFQAGRQ